MNSLCAHKRGEKSSLILYVCLLVLVKIFGISLSG